MLIRTETAFKEGRDVIYDATCIKKRDRSVVLDLAKKYGAKTMAFIMETAYDKCIEWNKMRTKERTIPNQVIKRMYDNYESPSSDEFDELVYVSIGGETGPKLYKAANIYYYTGCFLNEAASLELKKHRRGRSLSKENTDFHMTIQFSPQNVDERYFGEQIKLNIIGYGSSKDNEGFLVEAFSKSENVQRLIDLVEVPHVTMSVSENGRHHNTQFLSFQDIEPFEVIGIYGGCVLMDDNTRHIVLQYNDYEETRSILTEL